MYKRQVQQVPRVQLVSQVQRVSLVQLVPRVQQVPLVLLVLHQQVPLALLVLHQQVPLALPVLFNLQESTLLIIYIGTPISHLINGQLEIQILFKEVLLDKMDKEPMQLLLDTMQVNLLKVQAVLPLVLMQEMSIKM